MRTWLAPALLAAAATVAAPATAAQADVVAHWQLDEDEGASVMQDSASLGGDNDGDVVNVTTGDPALVSGKAYTFDGESSYVKVPDDNALDPGGETITITATVRVVDQAMADDSYDIVRKGYTTTKGGDWKMEIKRMSGNPSVGRLHCVFKGVMPDGRRQAAKRVAKVDVVDGRIHTLQCIRTATAVRAVVDGKVYTNQRASGTISNDKPLMLGAKEPRDDVLLGTLDDVIVDIG